MADYLGTERDDVLNQQALRLAEWSGSIRGLGGNDQITGGNIHLQGGAGNDLLIGTTPFTTVNYYDAPKGVRVDLAAGTAADGWGGVDTLRNIHVVHGSGHADWLKGSALADNFWVGVGDVVFGGKGVDTVTIWENSARWRIDKISGQHFRAVQTETGKSVELHEVEKLQFQDITIPLLYTEKLVYQDQAASVLPGAFLMCYSADLNQDGLWDLVIGGGIFPPLPSQETPVQVLLQQANGQFRKALITGDTEGFVHPRDMASGDFNGDGYTDVVVVGHGYDISPFPGETPTVLWGRADGTFRDGSEVMPQTAAFTHSVTVADVNLDGRDDIFLGNIWGQKQFTPRLLLGTSNSQFVEAKLPRSVGVNALQNSGTVPVASLLQDVTGDGRVDLVAGGGDSGVFLYPGLAVKQGQTTVDFFGERLPLPTGQFGTGTVTVDIQSHDINQDGRADLLLSQTSNSYQGRALQLLVQGPQGQWLDETAQRLHDWDVSSEWITFIHMTDLNQDGHKDLLASGTSNRSDAVFINDGTGHFSPAGSSNGFPVFSASWLMPAEPGKLLSVSHSSAGQISVRSIGLDPGLTGPDGSLPAEMGAPGFNEQFYLRHHPSVAADVAAGRVESGLASYLSVGRALGDRAYAPGTTVWGTAGLDEVHYSGRLGNHTVKRHSSGDWHLSGGSTGAAQDVFKSIERIHFQDTSLSLDLNANAGLVAKTLGAVFGKAAIANKAYAGIGLHYVDELDYSYADLMQLAIEARLGAKPSHNQVVDVLYTNLVGQAPDAAMRKAYTDLLDKGTFTVASLGVLAADSDMNKTNINLIGLSQTGLEYQPLNG